MPFNLLKRVTPVEDATSLTKPQKRYRNMFQKQRHIETLKFNTLIQNRQSASEHKDCMVFTDWSDTTVVDDPHAASARKLKPSQVPYLQCIQLHLCSSMLQSVRKCSSVHCTLHSVIKTHSHRMQQTTSVTACSLNTIHIKPILVTPLCLEIQNTLHGVP